MSINGKRAYVPPDVIKELQSIQAEESLKRQADAMRKMANYSNQARMVAKMFGWKL
jgi:hypothetical protein